MTLPVNLIIYTIRLLFCILEKKRCLFFYHLHKKLLTFLAIFFFFLSLGIVQFNLYSKFYNISWKNWKGKNYLLYPFFPPATSFFVCVHMSFGHLDSFVWCLEGRCEVVFDLSLPGSPWKHVTCLQNSVCLQISVYDEANSIGEFLLLISKFKSLVSCFIFFSPSGSKKGS